MLTETNQIHILRQYGVRPSVHRLAVLDYVSNRRTHPTADEVYAAVAVDFPSVSKTTVYNSLHTLVEAGVLRELDIESPSMRYDLALQQPHSHFRCSRCGKIFDMALPAQLDSIVQPGFVVETTDLFFVGLCPECSKEIIKQHQTHSAK
ncbi:MAG: transcriptional repressor [Muribaculaceae bacterium]|nr:transcriptional repressor [Muribaculaceae bacterium]